jgi:hypothetical protein
MNCLAFLFPEYHYIRVRQGVLTDSREIKKQSSQCVHTGIQQRHSHHAGKTIETGENAGNMQALTY